MELVIVMVVIGVLTAIAIPNYTAYIQRSRRAEARNQVLEATVWTERFRTQMGRFDNPLAAGTQTLPVALQCVPRNATGYGTCRDYEVEYETVTVTTYLIRARNLATGLMAGDAPICGNLRVDETGRRTFTGAGGTQDICWTR